MTDKNLHLVCNAHIDPVWLWEWQEGLAETLSTFRQAAVFCKEYDGFVFCHNESLLYEWVAEYDPQLFRKIQKLVKAGKWVVMGGWYLQPDCNMPSGEFLVRQILTGKRFFSESFSVEPTCAVNLDPFGHSQGLVQILARSGYESYLFCRPGRNHLDVPDDFVWIGFDGSEVMAHRSAEHYNSEKGKAADKILRFVAEDPERSSAMLLWGIGNHGGGPSGEDLNQIEALKRQPEEWNLIHSQPEAYFDELKEMKQTLPRFRQDLTPWAVGCYTSMSRVKSTYRKLEAAYSITEKMVTHAYMQHKMPYPARELEMALKDLLFCQFHDILPGSGVREVEVQALRKMDHGLEILDRLRMKAFAGLVSDKPIAKPDEFPIFVYNHHPTDIEEVVIHELQAAEPNFASDTFMLPEITDSEGHIIDCQLEKESSNLTNDHRKRIVFKALLKASTLNRFNCYLRRVSILEKPPSPVQGDLHFAGDDLDIAINSETGLISWYRVAGIHFLKPEACCLLVMEDDADPWGMRTRGFRNLAGTFRLMPVHETAGFAGTGGPVAPVRIIEEGRIRTVVEALFRYNHSTAVVHYKIPRTGTEVEIEIRLYWMEKDKMLKLSLPTTLDQALCRGEAPFGIQQFWNGEEEQVAQRWSGFFDEQLNLAFTVCNQSTYGFDHAAGDLRLSLVRSPAYAAHPQNETEPLVKQDRFTARIDQGEHLFRFRINAGDLDDRYEKIDMESSRLNEKPPALCFYPNGAGNGSPQGVVLSNSRIRLSALKRSEDGTSLIIRLFETSGRNQVSSIHIPTRNLELQLSFTPFEIKTLSLNLTSGNLSEVNLLER